MTAGLALVLLGTTAYRLNQSIPFVTDIRPSPAVMEFAILADFWWRPGRRSSISPAHARIRVSRGGRDAVLPDP